MALFDGKKSGKITAADIRKKYDESNRMLQKEQWTYVLNRAFLQNEQWVNFDRVRQTVAAIPREPDRVRCTFNELWPASRHLMAKLMSRPLVFEVAPSEADDASVRGSHVAEAILEDVHRYHNWEESREHLAWATWLGGTAVLALDWDQSAGTTVTYNDYGRPVGTGEICETPLNILEVGWEPGARDAERGRWWVRAQAMPPADVQELYELKDCPAADAGAAQGYLGRTLTVEDIGRPRPDLTLVLTYYERPNKLRPEGVVATVVNDKIVDGPHPWPFPFKDRLNMVVFRETKLIGKAHGDTVFTSAVPIQVAYNHAWSNIIEHLKLTGNARLLIPDASIDNIEDLTDLPGELINYNNAAGKPEWMSPAVMPTWVVEAPRLIKQQLDDTLGLHDISRGVAPSNIESGVGLSVLVEQDATPVGGLTRELAYGFERFACLVLETYAAKVKSSRKARVKQAGGAPEVVEWTGKSLAGQTVASVPIDAVMPRSRTALLAVAKELWDRQIVQDAQMFTRIADLPDQDDLLDAIDPDTAKAQRENRDMAIGSIRVPREFDNHAKHILRHNDFRKTLRYETLPAEWQNYVDQHIEAHETMAAEEMGQQVQRSNVHPAFAAVPTAEEAAPLPPGMVPGGAEGAPGMMAQEPGVPSGREGQPPSAGPAGMPDMGDMMGVPDQSGPVPS